MWRNKKNGFIYTIRTPTERDQIEQITTKNVNQNAYLDKIDRENTTARGKKFIEAKLGISLVHLF